jgi:hypothetical protein
MLPCRKTRLNAVQAVATQCNRLQIVQCCNTIQLVAELCSVATQYAIGRLSRLHRIAAEQVALAHCSAYLLLQEDAMAALVALLFCHEPDLCFKENKSVIELGHQYAAKPQPAALRLYRRCIHSSTALRPRPTAQPIQTLLGQSCRLSVKCRQLCRPCEYTECARPAVSAQHHGVRSVGCSHGCGND